METHNLVQGSEDWHKFRMTHFGASEASTMLGISPYLTRNELLRYKAIGKSKEYSDYVQKNILDYGHEVEAMARAILEESIGEELFPATCSENEFSASCDGITIDYSTAFEHKQFNESLFSLVESGIVPDHYYAQCQQIMLVTGAEKVIFVCSDGTKNNWAQVEVHEDIRFFEKLIAGWAQFSKDLENYSHKEFAQKPEADAIMQLPTLSIQIKGEVTLSNLPEFKQAAETFIANINTELSTDEDFANAEATVKFCDETEKKLESAKQAAIGQTASIDELMRTIDHIKDQIRSKRLTLDKLVKSQKEKIKQEIIHNGYSICEKHAYALDEFKQVNFTKLSTEILCKADLESACKNKRTLASLHNAVDTEVAAIKIKLDELARVVRKNLTHLPEDLSLFRDLQSIITKPEDDFKLIVETRLAEQKRKDDEARERAIAEATERMKKVKEEESERIAALPTDIKSVLADEKNQAEIIKSEAIGNNVVEFVHPLAALHDKAINEAIDSLCECCGKYGVTREIATEVIDSIIVGKVKNVRFL